MDDFRKAGARNLGPGGWKNKCGCCGPGSVGGKAAGRRLARIRMGEQLRELLREELVVAEQDAAALTAEEEAAVQAQVEAAWEAWEAAHSIPRLEAMIEFARQADSDEAYDLQDYLQMAEADMIELGWR